MNTEIKIFADPEDVYKDYKGKCAFCKTEFKDPQELDRHSCPEKKRK